MNSHLQLVKEKLQFLAAETDNVKKSAEFQQYLDTIAKFWEYSYHNQLLIYFALPTATKVAGFRTWSKLGRFVKKGSKAIHILAPFTGTKVNEQNEEEQYTYFVPVNVFDVSQTEGKELADLNIQLEGNDQQKLLDALTTFCEVKNIKLDFQNLGVNGLYGYSQGGRVVVSSGDSVNMQVNTLVHEIAHELLHHPSELSKQQKEIQAEATAYVVCKHFGLETKSFTYLALHDVDATQIMANLEAIAKASKEVIEFVSFFS